MTIINIFKLHNTIFFAVFIILLYHSWNIIRLRLGLKLLYYFIWVLQVVDF